MITIPYLTPALAIALGLSITYGIYEHHAYSTYKLEVENQDLKAVQDESDRIIQKFRDQTAIQVESFDREAKSKLSADAANIVSSRLRGQITSLKASIPTLTVTQCQGVADTYGGLFGTCQERYRELGETANRLRNVATTCEKEADSIIK